MTTQTGSLYINNNGMMSCIAHAGSYLSSAYGAKPEAAEYRTPLDTWERIDTDYIIEWTDIMGSAPKCEMCN